MAPVDSPEHSRSPPFACARENGPQAISNGTVKKYWTQPKYKRYIRLTQRNAAKRKQPSRGNRIRGDRRPPSRPTSGKPQHRIEAPSVFSLIKAPDQTLEFLEEIRQRAVRWSLFIDLNQVKIIDPEAVAAFVAVMESRNLEARGNQPLDANCRRRLHDFGFFKRVSGVQSAETSGEFRMEHVGTDVDTESVQSLIAFGMRQLGLDEKHGPSYRMFCEAISNTFQHADRNRRQSGTMRWWAHAYFDAARNVVCFTSIDVGVGIVKSLDNRQRLAELQEWHLMGLSQGERLKRLLEGVTIPSRTGERHRGRGLPSMRSECKHHRIKNLVITTNRGFARVATDTYENLKGGFPGTIVYWEVEGLDGRSNDDDSHR